MPIRRKNLLDAFRVATPDKMGAAGDAQRAPVPAAPPRAAAVPARAPAPARAPYRATEGSPRISRDRLAVLALLSVVVVLGVVWFLRSKSAGVGAAETPVAPTAETAGTSRTAADPAGAVQQNPVPQAAVKPPSPLVAGATADDQSFHDRANKFTVRVAQYDNDAAGKKLAYDTYAYLRGEGVRAVQPIESGDRKHIIVCADAKPTKDELSGPNSALKFVQKLRGPGKSAKATPFADAYVDNIDHVMRRP